MPADVEITVKGYKYRFNNVGLIVTFNDEEDAENPRIVRESEPDDSTLWHLEDEDPLGLEE
jgi:hypothetical protein